MLLLFCTFVWFNVAAYVIPLCTNTLTFLVWTCASTGTFPFKITFTSFFYYCVSGLTFYLGLDLSVSLAFWISPLEDVFASGLSYFESFFDDFEALISMLSDVLIFLSGEGSFWATDLVRFPLGSTVEVLIG